MEIGSEKWKQLIINAALQFDIHIDLNQAEMFAVHAELLLEWNRKTNLTAVTDPMGVAVKHFVDSLIPGKQVLPDTTMLDIGSGAGFPGIPLKILLPSLRVTLIDATRKKVSFLKHVIRTLKLDNIEARHMRAEDLSNQRNGSDGFDIIMSRALSSLENFVSMAAPLLAKDGVILALKGSEFKEDIELLNPRNGGCADRLVIGNIEFDLTVETYSLPFLESQRSIIILKHL